MNHKLLSIITTILALGTSVFAHNSQVKAVSLNLKSDRNQTNLQQQSQANTPKLELDNPNFKNKNLIGTNARLAREANNNQEQLAKIHPHTMNGLNAATLLVRNIPILTFLGSKIASNTSINTDSVEPQQTKSSNKINAENDPVSRANLVASQLTKLSQTGINARDIQVRWDAITKGYSIKVKDREIVVINDRTILPDTTNNLAEDALQATNRLRRLMGNAPPLRAIMDMPRKMPRKISTRLQEVPQNRVVRQIIGQASWYGPGFHGRTTANGERYNQEGMTAAHPSLPFGTKIKVTNKNNGRSVVVRVNDRGPYAGGRVLDLSAGAARLLGMMGSGVAPVQLEILAR
jgi:rare lipoprotein A